MWDDDHSISQLNLGWPKEIEKSACPPYVDLNLFHVAHEFKYPKTEHVELG